MVFQTVAKAVELKSLIDNAHRHLPIICQCVSLELEFRRQYVSKKDERSYRYRRSENTDDKKLEKLQEKLVEIYGIQGFRIKNFGFEGAGISVLGKDFASLEKILLEDVQRWYTTGTSSGFGNVLKQETQHDAQVRSSRELDPSQFSVSQELLDDVALKWGKYFVPGSVTVQPYKIVIYGPGDHFALHKDTPEERLCGTFLITLFQNCSPCYAFEIHQNGNSRYWTSHRSNGWCTFYPDIVHSVDPLESGFRAILSFKVFAKETSALQEWNTNEAVKMSVQYVADEIKNLNRPLGILLNHHYGCESKSLYGCDKLLFNALKEKGLQVEMKPVLVHFEGTGPDPAEYRCMDISVSSKVYSLTEEALDFVRQSLQGDDVKELYTESTTDLMFLDGHDDKRKGLWDKVEEEAIEYTGNESQPHSENSVYVRYAAIVMSEDNIA